MRQIDSYAGKITDLERLLVAVESQADVDKQVDDSVTKYRRERLVEKTRESMRMLERSATRITMTEFTPVEDLLVQSQYSTWIIGGRHREGYIATVISKR